MITNTLVSVYLLAISAAPAAVPAGPVSYYKQVRPLFQVHCQCCHQPAKAQGV